MILMMWLRAQALADYLGSNPSNSTSQLRNLG